MESVRPFQAVPADDENPAVRPNDLKIGRIDAEVKNNEYRNILDPAIHLNKVVATQVEMARYYS